MIIDLKEKNKLLKVILILLSSFFVFLFLKTLINYQGNKLIYIAFSILFNLLILNFLLRKTTFYEIFFGLLIWMGFWLKFSVFESNIYRLPSIFDGQALCNFDRKNFDSILLISSFGCLGFILSILLFSYLKKIKLINSNNYKFSIKKKSLYTLFLIFVICYLILIILNFNFGYYRKGLLPNNNLFYLESIFLPYFYTIGFGAAICFFIYNLNILNNKKNIYFILILICIEGFLTNTSMLSRNMVLYSSSIFFGFMILINKKNSVELKKFLLLSITFLTITFILSIFLSNKLRSTQYLALDAENLNKKYECKIKENKKIVRGPKILDLFLTRSIGIEGVMTTYNNKDKLSFSLLKKSFSEKTLGKRSFYEENFLGDQIKKTYKESNQVILPGIFGYLFFSGSTIFLFFTVFLFSLVFMLFEKIVIIFTKNIVLASFLSFVIVWRLINFGYAVSNTKNFIIAIILTLVVIYILQKFIKKNEY